MEERLASLHFFPLFSLSLLFSLFLSFFHPLLRLVLLHFLSFFFPRFVSFLSEFLEIYRHDDIPS